MIDVTHPFVAWRFPALFAELPEPGYYFSWFKILLFTLAAVLWFHCSAWVDKDSVKVRANRPQWTGLVFGCGLLAMLLWVFAIPVWWAGLIAFVVVFGGPAVTYVIYRNGRVSPSQTVLTPAHFQRLFAGKPQTEETIHAKDRVRIKDAEGKMPSWPTDPVQHDGYQALQDLLFDALWRRASDVDMTLAGQQCRILYKVDGVVRERDPLLRPQADVVFSHLKRIAGMDPEEVRKPQDGKLGATIGVGGSSDKATEVQVKAFGSTSGQRVQMRMVTAESRYRVSDVGFSKPQLGDLEPLIERLDGLIVLSGPKESGLSSMLYSMIRQHDAFMRNIHTMETAKVMELENVTQHVHDSKGGTVSFSRALQSVLRTDPDIIMVSDAVDSETTSLCADFSAQKKIYLGVTANDAFEALRKYMQMVGDNPLVAKTTLAVVCSRLIRKLCTNCRKGYRPDIALLKKANLPTDQNRLFYRPPNREEVEVDKQGNPIVCPVCQGSGYLGRTGIFEVLVIDDALRALISQGAPLQAIKNQARKGKMLYMQEVGLQKVMEGLTSINEVLRVTKDEGTAGAPTAKATA